jgi:hypothetical protein
MTSRPGAAACAFASFPRTQRCPEHALIACTSLSQRSQGHRNGDHSSLALQRSREPSPNRITPAKSRSAASPCNWTNLSAHSRLTCTCPRPYFATVSTPSSATLRRAIRRERFPRSRSSAGPEPKRAAFASPFLNKRGTLYKTSVDHSPIS